MAASEAVEADPAALASRAPAVPAAARGAAAASGPWGPPRQLRGSQPDGGEAAAHGFSFAGPGAHPAAGERAVLGREDQHPVHGAQL